MTSQSHEGLENSRCSIAYVNLFLWQNFFCMCFQSYFPDFFRLEQSFFHNVHEGFAIPITCRRRHWQACHESGDEQLECALL